jgi:hypothetical protein
MSTHKDSDVVDQRDDHRFGTALRATVRFRGRVFACSASDLSRGGVLLVGEFPEPDRPEVDLTVATPGGDLELQTGARVAYVKHNAESGQTRLGVQFPALQASQRETLEALVSRVVEGMAPPSLQELQDGASDAEIRSALAKIPLAHRVSLARRGHSKEREILRNDADPQVLEGLARNPNITLPEMITLTRMQSLLPSTMEIIAKDQRWSRSDELKIQIATHPRASFEVVDKLISSISDLLLQRVIHRPGLNPAVREKVMRRLARKRR